MPKIVDVNRRRQEIVDKAVQLFLREGYYGSNLSRLALDCGVGRTTLYKYFRNKQDIYIYAVDTLFDLYDSDITRIAGEKGSDAFDKVKQILERLLLGAKENKDIVALVLNLALHLSREENVSEHAKSRMKHLREMIESVLDEGIRSGSIRSHDSRAMSLTLSAMIEAFVIHSSETSNFSMEDALASTMLLLESLKPR